MENNNISLHNLEKKDIEKAINILVEAFIEYPMPGGIIKSIKRRRIALRELFKYEIKRCLRHGNVLTLGGDFKGVSVWRNDLKLSNELSYLPYTSWSSLRLLTAITFSEARKIFRITKEIMRIIDGLNLAQNTAELFILGVHPDNSGQGRAGKIIRAMLANYDSEGRDCLVMTNNSTNKKIYEKLGFVTIEDRMIEDIRIIYLLHKANSSSD